MSSWAETAAMATARTVAKMVAFMTAVCGRIGGIGEIGEIGGIVYLRGIGRYEKRKGEKGAGYWGLKLGCKLAFIYKSGLAILSMYMEVSMYTARMVRSIPWRFQTEGPKQGVSTPGGWVCSRETYSS